MRLAVVSHKDCWPSDQAASGYATDGGFALQMEAIAELFDHTDICVPVLSERRAAGELPFRGPRTRIVALPTLAGHGLRRKLAYPAWFARAGWRIDRVIAGADAVHVPIPGDIGTAGMLLAKLHRKPLFVRHCGNWENQRTWAERFWRRFMEWRAPTTDVMVATGGADHPPSARRAGIGWIFSTSLRHAELAGLDGEREPPTNGQLALVTTGRQVESKGTGAAIRALPAVRAAFPDATLHIVGDGPDLDRFGVLASELGVAEAVVFHGKVDHDEVMAILQRSSVFVFPTHSEGFPKSVVEALACGLPVVATGVSVIPQLLSSGAGRTIERPDPALVAQAVVDIGSDPAAYRAMSVEARRVAGSYTLEAWRDRIGELLAPWGPLRSGSTGADL